MIGMTENKRFGMIKTQFNGLYVPIDEWDQFIFSSFESELDCMRIVNALNYLHESAMNNGRIASELLNAKEQLEKENKELQDTIETICKDFEASHGMDIRNADWFTAW